ncbi:MAG: tRNA (N(6)-L-threonylcarbamoyladenosine(37)-C(2))-methylthiotransferase MtaB [Candidatus Cryptobacteroides sp.]|jgi:threonylcarbamoyladenosine tRNA methylthiotransferase MtaB
MGAHNGFRRQRGVKIAFVTLGCKLNYAETSTYERDFASAGLEPVSWKDGADVFVVNTCTVTATANKKSRSEIRKLHRINPNAPIIVTGCYAQMKPEEVGAIEGVKMVVGTEDKAVLVERTLGLLGAEGFAQSGQVDSSGQVNTAETERSNIFGAYSSGERTRSFLKVQDGCDNFCRYCIVPYARGRSRNIPICQAVKYAQEIAAKGIKEIVLTGVNTGDFGLSTGESFLDLLKALNGVDGIERYRISSIEPNLLTNDIIDWIASDTKFQPHFHIPLQVGCDELLSSMGRKYSTSEFAEKIEYIRHAMEGPGKPLVFFGIDVMAGLPGENEELFCKSYNFLEQIKPAFIHIFPYSKRPGTPAAVMPGQTSPQVKASRVARLEELSSRLHSEFIEANKGICERVLWESREKDGTMAGYTGNYIRLSRPYEKNKVNTIENIVI